MFRLALLAGLLCITTSLGGEEEELSLTLKTTLLNDMPESKSIQDLGNQLEKRVGLLCEQFNLKFKKETGKRPCFDKLFCADDYIIRSTSNNLNLRVRLEVYENEEIAVVLTAGLRFNSSSDKTAGLCWHPRLYPPYQQAYQEIVEAITNSSNS